MSEAIEALRKKLIKKVKTEVAEKYSEKDTHIIRASNALDDLDSIFNLLAEHAIEWHGTTFPELSRIVKDNGKYLELASKLGERKNFTQENVSKIIENPEIVSKIIEKTQNSMGSDIDDETLIELQKFCEKALSLKNEREDLAKFIEKKMLETSPNFSKIAGALLGAKLLSAAGGLEKLAMLPSSTIQLLGAEKALFQHLKTGSAPPKHGLIYQHPLVKKLRPWQKGNISRTLAGKLSICARTDFYGKENIVAGEIQKQLEKRVLEIEKQKPNPKPRSQQYPVPKSFERTSFQRQKSGESKNSNFPKPKFGENRNSSPSATPNKIFGSNGIKPFKKFEGNKRFGKKPFKKRY